MPQDKTTKIVKYGIIGCGSIAQRYVKVFNNLNIATVEAVADINLLKSVELARQLKCNYYTDYRYLLENQNIDVIIIATPSGLHAPIAIEALHAGKHVIVEKPMAMTLEQAETMIDTAKRYNLILTTMLNNRFLPACIYLKGILDKGILGRLISGSINVYWYRPQEYYDESEWRGTISMDGGVLMNQAIHHIDLLLWYMGTIKEVYALRATLGHNIEAEDTAVAVLEFNNNALGTINVTTSAYPQNMLETLTIIGDKGCVILGGQKLNNFLAWQVEGITLQSALNIINKIDIPKWYGHYKAIEDVSQAILDKRKQFIKSTDGKLAIELVVKIYKETSIIRREIIK